MTEKVASIEDFDMRASASRGFEIELEYPRGQGLGVYMTVLGEQSSEVEGFETERVDARAEKAFDPKQKKLVWTRSSKEILADNLESAVFRVIGWRGLREQFSKELLQKFLSRNPDFVDQILAASRDRANFTLA